MYTLMQKLYRIPIILLGKPVNKLLSIEEVEEQNFCKMSNEICLPMYICTSNVDTVLIAVSICNDHDHVKHAFINIFFRS